MVLALTCELCTAVPGTATVGSSDRPVLVEERLSLAAVDQAVPTAPAPLALAPLADRGSGGGEDGSDHMTTMWLVMGAVMVAMMVGMGMYFMRHGASGTAIRPDAVGSPAGVAIPVTGRGAPGG